MYELFIQDFVSVPETDFTTHFKLLLRKAVFFAQTHTVPILFCILTYDSIGYYT